MLFSITSYHRSIPLWPTGCNLLLFPSNSRSFLQIHDCVALTPTAIAIAGPVSHSHSLGTKNANASGSTVNAARGGCSLWLLDCAALCSALASNALACSPSLVSRVRVWTSPAEKSASHAITDDDLGSNDVRLLPLSGLNLLAVCTANGSIQLLNTHGVSFSIRSSFTRHTQPVHAIALCDHECLVISGGVSRYARVKLYL